ncbi:hypothetical protein JO972_10215 [Verrucomicrobiaceae bacterium 5K15]|uniref:Uncharacterized protein n=1 Tax=Oceaniferula flava TaxID=2800421 RepID=A0AAE2SBC8_9BACT|nr:hypothetical protein [Oceaniferula flavus]MBK1855333.1 hypothetical protein [Oceaniferula flavus]MBM1136639.1 hypothetical protein [Oceaniferula flavus]
MSKCPWSDPEKIAALSRTEIGEQLAARVAAQLVADNGQAGIWQSHQSYCGHGLVFADGKICLVSVHDGDVLYGPRLLEWQQPDTFVIWLSRQSDFTLSGADRSVPELFTKSRFRRNNQRLTRAKLEHYVLDSAGR